MHAPQAAVTTSVIELVGSHSLLHDDSAGKCAYEQALADASTIPCGPLENTYVELMPCEVTILPRLGSPSARSLVLSRVPTRVHADAPLEMEVADSGNGAAVDASAASMGRWLSAHAKVSLVVGMKGQVDASYSVPVAVRPSGNGWIARVLIHPATWANVASVTVLSLSLAGRPLPCDCLPATLRVGFNHTRAPAGAVHSAAKAGDMPALQAALEAGGSTEETDAVRRGGCVGSLAMAVGQRKEPTTRPPCRPSLLLLSAAGRLDCSLLGRIRRPPRGPPHAPCGRR